MKLKSLSIVMAVLMVMALLGACQSGQSPSQSAAPSSAPPASTTPASGEASAAPSAAEPAPADYAGKTITVMFMSGDYAASTLELVVPEFEKVTGAKVEVVDFPYNTMPEKMMLDFTGGGAAAYDVLQVACQWDGYMAPYLMDLEPFIQRDNFDIEDFDQNILDNSGRWEGVIRGIPHVNTPYNMLYRTDLVETPPTTWEEYIAIAEKHHDPANGMYGVAPAAAKGQYGSVLYSRVWSMGGEWADEDWNPNWDTPETRRALEISKRIIELSDPASLNWGLPEAGAAFAAGNAVFLEAWPAMSYISPLSGTDANKIGDNWAMAPFPKDATGLTNLSSWNLAINSKSAEADLSWEFIKMYTSTEVAIKMFENYNILHPRQSFWEADVVKNSNLYPMRESLPDAVIWWRIPAGEEVRTELPNGWHAYLAGESTLDEAIDYMNTAIKRALTDNPPPEGVKNALWQLVESRKSS